MISLGKNFFSLTYNSVRFVQRYYAIKDIFSVQWNLDLTIILSITNIIHKHKTGMNVNMWLKLNAKHTSEYKIDVIHLYKIG